jgi:hypothetical protein
MFSHCGGGWAKVVVAAGHVGEGLAEDLCRRGGRIGECHWKKCHWKWWNYVQHNDGVVVGEEGAGGAASTARRITRNFDRFFVVVFGIRKQPMILGEVRLRA